MSDVQTAQSLSSVRVADSCDVPRIVEMGLAFLRDSSYRNLFVENPAQMEALARRLVTNEHGTILLLEREDESVGMIGLIFYRHFISDQPIAGEVFYWVEPKARGTGGLRLFKAAEQWARQQGAESLQMISPDDRTDRLYQRLGYRAVERTFQRRFR